MKGKRRRHDLEFKARMAVEALKNIKTAPQIAKEFQIHPAQVSDWKKQMLDGATDLFGAGKKKLAEEDLEAEKCKRRNLVRLSLELQLGEAQILFTGKLLSRRKWLCSSA